MDGNITQEQRALRSQLQEARIRAERLRQDLQGIDGALEALTPSRKHYQLLEQACSSLEKLGDHGMAALFWGETQGSGSAECLPQARKRLDEFLLHLRELDDQRRSIVTQLGEHDEAYALLCEDLYELQQQEERRKQEWIVEREVSALPDRAAVMAWSSGGQDDQRLRKALASSVLLCALLIMITSMIDLPVLKLTEEIEIPERLVQLVREEQARRALPPPVESTEPERQQKKQETEPPKEQPPKPSEEQLPAFANSAPQAPEAPKQAGILAFREKFATLAQDTAPRLGLQARVSADAPSAGRNERAMLTTNAPGSSGGINLASLSRNVGGGGGGAGAMAGVQVTRATSSIGGIGAPGGDRPLSGDNPALSRTDEEIQIVFDRYKAALYRLYNRELRKDPSLRGQLVLRLTIEPDGAVSVCELQASDMNAPELSAQVVDRVRSINFGAKDGVSAITILYPIDFLPAA